MQRTSIYANAHVFDESYQSHQICPNCQSFKQQIQDLKKEMADKFSQIDMVKPTIIEMLQGQDMMKYQEELYKLKSNYEKLLKKIDRLDQENQQLQQENQKVCRQNRTLKRQLKEAESSKQKIEQESYFQQINKQNGRILKTKNGILNELTNNVVEKPPKKCDKQQKQSNYLIQLLDKRIKIQGERHNKIQILEQLLKDI